MRSRILFVLIALVVLRGWVGGAMAGQMVDQQLAAIEMIAAEAIPERLAGQFDSKMAAEHAPDCHGAQAPATQPAAQPADASHAGCASCLHCQACSSAALVAAVPALPGALPHAPPQGGAARFASALPAPGFKPPIS